MGNNRRMSVPKRLLAFILSVLFVGVPTAAAPAPPNATPSELVLRVRQWRKAHERAVLAEFIDLLALPNVARDAPNIERNAEAIVAMLRRRGFAPELLRVPGAPPIVVAERRGSAAQRTVTYYAHYDGQPADAARWHGEPWTPVLRDRALEAGGRIVDWKDTRLALDPEGRVYARSAGDDKAAVIGLLAAWDALTALGEAPRSNVRFLFEGEEEAGSPHLAAFLKAHKDRLLTDAWLICDGPVFQNRDPMVAFGARGVIGLDLTVFGPNHGLHSGHFGNWAPNPIAHLTKLIASMVDSDGRILIDGFGDRVRPLSERERAALAAIPVIEPALRRELGLAAAGTAMRSLPASVQAPALNLRGIAGGHVGQEAQNTVPPTATASIDFRLVPDQTLEEVRRAVEPHIERQGFHIVREVPDEAARLASPRPIHVQWGSGYPASRTGMDEPFARDVVSILEKGRGQPLVKLPMLGGSVPMQVFRGEAGTPAIIVPIANHDDNQHTADENLRLQNLWDGIETYAVLLAGL